MLNLPKPQGLRTPSQESLPTTASSLSPEAGPAMHKMHSKLKSKLTSDQQKDGPKQYGDLALKRNKSLILEKEIPLNERFSISWSNVNYYVPISAEEATNLKL